MNLASLGKRFLGSLIDGCLFSIPTLARLYAPLSVRTALVLVLWTILLSIHIYLLTTRGQSIGKIVMKTRIVGIDTGENKGFVANVLLRGLLNSILCIIPLYVVVDSCFVFRDDRRCLHDLIGGTKVINA
jgi:uncharacterized RDD family membrane protein YckC